MSEPADSAPASPDTGGTRSYPPGPGPWRAASVLAAMIGTVWFLAGRVQTGEDDTIHRVGRIEVTARLAECPDQFPQLGAYRYTYTVRYEVLLVHRQDPAGRYPLQPGDPIFVGHYKPWMPRDQIKDADWGEDPLGGKVARLTRGAVHRVALDYELQDLAPSGVLDYLYPPGTNRFFAIWANPTTL